MMQDETTVVTPRMTFHCRTWGEDDGIPVMLLHGSYGTSRWWEAVCHFPARADLLLCAGSARLWRQQQD